MTKVEEMWTALAAYQPQADAAGHGPSWARMCKEKNVEAAAAAAAANADAAAAVYYAAVAVYYAADAVAADAVADAKKWSQIAIDRITKVLVKPAPEQYTALEQALTRLQKRYAELEAKTAPQRQWDYDTLYAAWHAVGADVAGLKWETFVAKLKEKNNG
jgi:hypothetical protein